MTANDFIFLAGNWLGEGKITLSHSNDFIKFYTKWQITEEKNKMNKALQTVEMQGIKDQIINQFSFQLVTEKKIIVTLENQLVGKIQGTGLRDSSLIAWEFRQPHFEGFESYELQENGDYFFHAEYGAADQFRTLIEGLIWRKS